MQQAIKLSEILKEFRVDNDCKFICHAAEDIVNRETKFNVRCISAQTFDEFRRIMPEYIRSVDYDGTLNNWVRYLPSHLRISMNEQSTKQFRIKFLKWAIKKFGDQELTFTFL